MGVEDLIYPLLGRYFAAPDWLKIPLGHLYGLVPPRVRLGPAYARFRDELAAVRRSPECAAALARQKLRASLEWAIETVPAYQPFRPELACLDDPVAVLERLPVTDKVAIKNAPERYLSAAMPATERLRTETGGSTLNPLVFYLQKHVTRPREYAFMEEFRSRVGHAKDDVTLGLLGRIYPKNERMETSLWTYEPIKRHLVLNPSHLSDRYMERFAQVLLEYRPRFIEGFPSMLYPLARWLSANPLPEFTAGVRGVMLISENVHDYQMRLFRDVFRCPVLRHYGHSERILMAATMPDDDRYFFWPHYGHVELLDFDDKPITRPGELGQIVGTAFDNRAMPFVRYRTGDLAVLSERAHPQLPGFVACERIEGRVQEFIVDRRQRLISLLAVGSAHFAWFSRIEAIQYEQERPGELVVKFKASKSFSAEMQQLLAEAVARRTCCDVRLVPVEEVPRTPSGKQQLLVQKLDIARYLGSAHSPALVA